MTQHQAPEVTSEDRKAAWPYADFHCLPDCQMRERWFAGHYDTLSEGAAIRSFAEHRTRATQPLSLTVDDEAIDRAARAISLVDVNYDFDALGKSTKEHYRRMARAALGEQIAENANCSVDIDRSGLAQEVES